MNVATEFDIGPLTWVKSEIDLALDRADQALQAFSAGLAERPGDLTQIRFSRTHLHQVQGALTIVGLDGVMQFAQAVESMLEDIEQETRPAEESVLVLARRSLSTIGHYLDDLIDGQPNQPLRLLDIYTEVQKARGIERIAPSDLFFPDLNVRPPRRTVPVARVSPAELQRLARQERARFQKGLLAWLRTPGDRSGINEMLAAVRRIESAQEAPAARSFWWIATGFLSALADGTLPAETNVKQLCARIDLQLRRLFEGSRNVAERLMRDALYYVAKADSGDSAVRSVKSAYQLDTAIPLAVTGAPEPKEAVRRKLREIIVSTEESWNKFCAGTAQALPAFKEHARALASVVEQLGHTDYRRLAQAIAAAANWLSEDSSRFSESAAMEIATAILLTQNAQENLHRLGSDFAHQVDVTVARIHGCIAGTPPQPGSEIPLLDEMSRQAQEKLLIVQVAKEIQNNLGQIEQVLDNFFRDVEKRADLTGLETPLRQIAGALTIMRHDTAVAALQECSTEIRRFADPAYTPVESDFERVASQLSLIGFFIDSLQHGTQDFDAFVRQMQAGNQPPVEEEEPDEGFETGISVEKELELQKIETHALLEALKAQPDDAGLREEIRQNLSSLQKDADLVADASLGEQAKAVLSVLESGDAVSQDFERAMATLKPQAPSTPQPTEETLQLSRSSREEIDAELLGIFIEEAHEVLATIGKSAAALKEQPHDAEQLTTVRRAFHTLKGSGRMVGLKAVGEAAWAIEQTLNLWLRQELAVSPALIELIETAHGVFSAWVKSLENEQIEPPDPNAMIALAESLRNGPEPAVERPAAQPGPAEPVPESGPDEEEIFILDLDPAEEKLPRSAEIITLTFPSQPGSSDHSEPDHVADNISDETLSPPDQASEEPRPVVEALPTGEVEPSETETSEPPPRTQISSALFDIFFEEASSHLRTLQRELPVLEQEDSGPTPHEMYRAAHTFAGISATVGIDIANKLGLALEHALLRRDHSAHPGSLEALGTIRKAVGEVDLLLSALFAQREPAIPPGLIEELEALYPVQLPAKTEPARSEERTHEEPGGRLGSPAKEATDIPGFTPHKPFVVQIKQVKDEIDEQLLPIFLEEAQDLNQGIASQLRAWHGNPQSDEIVRTLARQLHTLKGSARMAGAMNLGEITHAIESRVEEAQKSGAVTPEVIDDIDNAFDAVTQIIERLQSGESLDQPADTAPSVDEPGSPPVPAAPQPAVPVVHERRNDPARSAIEPEAEAEISTQRATLRVRADLIDRLVNEAGELSIARARIEGEMRSLKDSLLDLTENVIRLRRQLRDIEIQAETQMQSRTAQTEVQHAGFDPLEFDRFTRFQELTRMMAESVNDVGTVQQHLLKNLDDANAAILAQARLNREIQQELMAVRMVPFGSLADRLYRIVRQTSKELSKRANLDLSGSQVELDRSVLDKMVAPLEHMLRNAIAHGLEERSVRTAKGKREIGEISLAVKQEGNEVILSLSDDGSGLDFTRIREHAVEVGLLQATEDAEDERLAEMIFAPGFSTASEVSRIAGRGVGMDVVRTEVAALGGRIEVHSKTGLGTEFRLYIPLTLAVTKALLVRVGNKTHAVPSVMIEQVLDLKENALTRIREAGAAEWMGYRYPFHFLPHLLGEPQSLPEQHRQYWVLLLRSGTRRIAVQVDELQGNKEIVVKNIGPQLARVIGIDGATVLGNGQVVLILNPIALSTRIQSGEAASPIPSEKRLSEEEQAIARLPTVMIVDDSLTVRKITGRLLAREGYQVISAKDGVEALEILIDTIPDVMLLDIEMPRLDGFDLTRNIRSDTRLKSIPIIMITSRTAEKHRSYAFEIGVNHFLGKPYQEEELLPLIADYVTRNKGV